MRCRPPRFFSNLWTIPARWATLGWMNPDRQCATTHRDPMTEPAAILYSGRRFSPEELALMRQASADYASLGITEIARTICEWLDWKRPNGQLKNHECRLLLERLQRERFLTLPPLRPSGRRGPRQVSTDVDTPPVIQATIAQLEPLLLTLVDASDSRLWRQFIERFHYLGCRVPVGPVTFCYTSLTA